MNTKKAILAKRKPTAGVQIAVAAALALTASFSIVATSTPSAYATVVLADVPPGTQFYSEMIWSVERGTLKTTADGRFLPLTSVGRATMAEVLYNLAGSPAYTPPAVSPFNDVPKTHPSYKQIAWVASKGISTGWADGTFRPAQDVTRDAMAAFMYRLAGKPEFVPPNTSPFTDITPSTQFYLEMNWLKSVSISTGWGDGTFRPLQPTARDAMAAFSFRLWNVMSTQTGIAEYVAILDDTLTGTATQRRSGTSVEIEGGSTEYMDMAAGMSAFMQTDEYPITGADSEHRVLSQSRNTDGTYTVEIEVATEFEFGERGEDVSGSAWTEPHTVIVDPNGGNPIIVEDQDDQFVPADNSEEPVLPLPPPADTTPLVESEFTSLQQEIAASPGVSARAFNLNIWAAQVYASDWSSWPYGGDDKRHFNPAYGFYANNCANFVSQILRAGELPTKPTVSPFDMQAWTPNIPVINKPTRTWTQASSQRGYMLHAGYHTLSNVYRTFPGDIIYVDWDTEGSNSRRPDGLIDHVMFVAIAQIAPGDEPVIVQKSPNRHMIPFNLVRARVASQDRIAHFYPLGYQHT
jgi:S-layer homology domain/Putative amidase domain